MVTENSATLPISSISQSSQNSQEKIAQRETKEAKSENVSKNQYSIPTEADEMLDRYESGEISRDEFMSEVEELYNRSVDTFGPIKRGEKAQEEINVSRRVAKDKKTHRFVRTELEADIFTDEMIDDHKADIILGNFAYEAVSDDAAMKKADQYIKNGRAESVWDNDMAKEELDEFDNGLGANAVHRESQDIITKVLARSINNGDNIVYLIVGGGDVNSLINKINNLKNKGYSVYLHLNELPHSKAIGRSLNRYIEKGRFIPPQIIKQYGDTPTQNFNTIINIGGLVDGYSHYSNDVSRDDKPKLIEISDNVRQFDERGYSVSKFGQGTGTAQKTESIAEDNSKNQYSIPTETEKLLDRYESGEISRDEFMSEVEELYNRVVDDFESNKQNGNKYSIGVGNGGGIERYTEKQYNDFGWVRYNDVLSTLEYNTLLSRYADFKHNNDKYPVTRWGEAVICSTECRDVIMYVRGPIRSPEITKIVRVNVGNSIEATIIKEGVIENERDKISLPYEPLEDAFGKEIFIISKKRDFASFQRYKSETEGRISQKDYSNSGTEQNRERGHYESNESNRLIFEQKKSANNSNIQYSIPTEADELLDDHKIDKNKKSTVLNCRFFY